MELGREKAWRRSASAVRVTDPVDKDVVDGGASLLIWVGGGGSGKDTILPDVKVRHAGVGSGVPSREQVEVNVVGLDGSVLG